MSLKLVPQIVLSIGLAGIGSIAFADGWDPTSEASNIGSIANTRHNLTTDYSPAVVLMDQVRNNYGSVCVYCHTPHGANKQINAPLWNRTVNLNEYTIYDRETTLGLAGRMSLPGPSSLTCLSCHDGTIAIDSVLNMPGSGLSPTGVGQNREVGQSNMDFLDQWAVAGNPGPSGAHFVLGGELGTPGASIGCSLCHNATSEAAGFAPDYSAFMLGTNLRNDHVIGIQFPTAFGPGIDYNEPDVTIPNRWAFFDTNGNGMAEKNEVRLYDSGDGPEVECASCHDPHGIPSNGAGTKFNPSFLRVNNGIADNGTSGTAGIISDGPSALCLTCHAK